MLEDIKEKVSLNIFGQSIIFKDLSSLNKNPSFQILNEGSLSDRVSIILLDLKDANWKKQLDRYFGISSNFFHLRIIYYNHELVDIKDLRRKSKDFRTKYLVSYKEGLQKVLDICENFYQSFYSSGSSYKALMEFKQAFMKDPSTNPEDFLSVYNKLNKNLATLEAGFEFYKILGQFGNQKRCLEEILRRDNSQLWAVTKLAEIAFTTGRAHYGCELLLKLHKQNRWNAKRLFMIGQFYLEIAKPKIALTFFQEGFNFFQTEVFTQKIKIIKLLEADPKIIQEVALNKEQTFFYFRSIMNMILREARKGQTKEPLLWLRVATVLASHLSIDALACCLHNLVVMEIKSGRLAQGKKVLEENIKKYPQLDKITHFNELKNQLTLLFQGKKEILAEIDYHDACGKTS